MLPTMIGCAQQGSSGSSPLEVELDQSFIQIDLFTEESQSSEPGQIEVTANAIGGTPPYSYLWSINRETDDDNAFSINMGTTNQDRWGDAIASTTYQGPPDFTQIPPGNLPPNPASYSIVCAVTDSLGDQVVGSMAIDVSAE